MVQLLHQNYKNTILYQEARGEEIIKKMSLKKKKKNDVTWTLPDLKVSVRRIYSRISAHLLCVWVAEDQVTSKIHIINTGFFLLFF